MHAMFAILVTICSLVASRSINTEEILSQLHRCHADMKLIETCIQHSINSMHTILSRGIPQLDIQPFDPYYIYHYEVNLTKASNRILTLKDILIKSLQTYNIENVRVNADRSEIDFTAFFPKITTTADYKINDTLDDIILEKQGKMIVNLLKITAVISIYGEYYINNDNAQRYFRVNTVTVIIKYGEIYVDFNNLSDLSNVKNYTDRFRGRNWWIIPEMVSKLQLIGADFIKTTANKIYSKFPIDMLIQL